MDSKIRSLLVSPSEMKKSIPVKPVTLQPPAVINNTPPVAGDNSQISLLLNKVGKATGMIPLNPFSSEKAVKTLPSIPNTSLNKSEKIDFSQRFSLGDGVTMFMPKNPVKADGTVDIIVQFRGVVPEGFSQGGVNAVVITAETSGLSAAMMQKFGQQGFVPSVIDKAMDKVKNQFGPNVKEGRLALGSFSAGYAPLREALANPVVKAKTDAVIILDGIHHGKYGQPNPAAHKPYLDFAKEAASGNKLMVISHSSIKTNNPAQNYSSSTNAADYILKNVGAVRVNEANQNKYTDRYSTRYKETVAPSTRADLNGFHVEGYSGGVAKSHVEQIDNLGNIWNEYLAPRWGE